MNSMSDNLIKQNGRINSSKFSGVSDVFEPTIILNDDTEAKQQIVLIDWINSIVPNLNLPLKASSEELRACLIDGTVLLQILNKLRPGFGGVSDHSTSSHPENIKKFLVTMGELGIKQFEISDLEKGSMKTVMDCLLALKEQFAFEVDNVSATSTTTRGGSRCGSVSSYGLPSPQSGEDKLKVLQDAKFRRAQRVPVMAEASTALMHHIGHKFHDVFQLKQGRYADLSATKISEMMRSSSLDNAPTQSLLSVVNGILDESVERKNGEIPHRVACLLRKVVQEIERRISTQAEHLRTQNNLFKAREEKYQSRIRVLEALASGTGEETLIVKGQLQQIKLEKTKMDEKKKFEEEDVIKLIREKEETNLELSTLKQALERARRTLELEKSEMDEKRKVEEEDMTKLMKEKEQINLQLSTLKQELEMAKKTLELGKSKTDERSTQKEEDVIKLMKEKEEIDLELSKLKQELEKAKRTLELEKSKMDGKSTREEDVIKLIKEKEQTNIELSTLKHELEIAKRALELEKSKMDEKRKAEEEDMIKSVKEKEQTNNELSALRQELEITKKTYELRCLQMETEAKDAKADLDKRLKELVQLLDDSRNKVKVLEAYSKSQKQKWNKKEIIFQRLTEFHFGALQELRLSSQCIKHEILKAKKSYSEDFNCLGLKFKKLVVEGENYHLVLAENRKLFNELQDLKGNIRVYCRIRPLLSGQAEKQTTIEYIGENGELVVANPSKQGKDGNRLFRFNKVYGPNSTQGEVFSDTQPLIRCVLDGYNVCIFAYGQTGSGKTYTMTGPNGATEEEWGVNYRALNDLFSISQNRSSSFMYEVGVQMLEIYNEQLRDLLANDGSQKRLGIKSISEHNGLVVPDATMHPVRSTSDVIELMDIGLNNRAVSATSLNERSSRSHSVVSIHVHGKDLHTGATSQGNLHLVDLAGSERVDRSEVTGDRLREAQHINKSLSALGDVIFALAQKSSHVPYRNSKLTQLLQTSLGGQAKTLMFVQLNPDVSSYSETISTLKFAERVSGVELGAARSSKEGNIRELMDQVASLKDTISEKDGEIERLQLLKDLKNDYPSVNGEKQGTPLKHGYSSVSNDSVRGALRNQKQSSKTTSDHDYCSENIDKHSELDSQQSAEDLKQQSRFLKQSKYSRGDINQDVEILGYADGDREDRLSDVSDGCLSVGTEPDISTGESTKPLESEGNKVLSRVRSLQKLKQTTSSSSRDSPRAPTSMRKTATTNTISVKPPRRWQ
ncbi:kinesin-like protein KIN-14K isoform X2 [Hevea brasiliensis]|uniref:kinesin-like protein KIN-14K isoform X2 n=1 Tax=Hevea brasiliensis TaxID=3981 RepID=UPI0025D5416B|nr:kinesin-like protein KIN-14K isoform X2 [Hevea brasiliensis]